MGYAVALVMFVVLFALSTILAVLFYTRIEMANESARKAREQLAKFASKSEQQIYQGPRTGDQTIVGELTAENDALKTIVIGPGTQSLAAIEGEIDALGQRVVDKSLLGFIRELMDTEVALRNERNDLEVKLGEVQEQLSEAHARNAELEQVFQGQVRTLQTQLKSVQAGYDQNVERLKQEMGRWKQRIVEVTEQQSEQAGQHQATVSQLNEEIHRLEQVIDELRNAPERQRRITAQVMPDGKIIEVVSGPDNLVYIDRGREDRIAEGMTFEVFDPGQKIRLAPDGRDLARGKATIEVLNVTPATSVARVVRRHEGATVVGGDNIANLVYDPERVFKFFVFGDFDLRNTGRTSSSDRRQIESMITDWGARLVDDLSYDVDYVVLGKEPKAPERNTEELFDPQASRARQAAQQRYDEYLEVINQARALGVPILNTNRFLDLVGYYQRN
jgi:hypothetical protein